MAASINYPSALDTDATVGGGNEPDGTTALDATDSGHPKHSVLHQNIGEAIQKIQTKVGKTDSSPSANKVLHSDATGDSAWTATPTVTSLTATDLTATGAVSGATLSISGAAVVNSLDVNGLVKVEDGSASAPTFTFDSDEGNGMYLGATDEINFATNGAKRVAIGNELLYLENGVDFFAFPNTGSGNDAEWVATGFGNYELKRNSSLRGEKENIQDPGDELTANMIDQVEPKLWNRIHSPGIPEIGPIAEDMEAISPHLGAHGFNEDGTTFLTGINKTTYLSLLVLAVKDLRTQVADLTARIDALEG